MKKFLLPVMAAAFSLAPIHQSKAIEFGEFKVGQTFKLKVTQVTSIKLQGSTETKVPIPSDIPKYLKGQTIAFEIVRKGALKTNKFSIPFVRDSGDYNLYNQVVYGVKNDSAFIYKSPTNRSTSGSLIFVRNVGTTSTPAIKKVTYTLEKP